MPRNAKNITTKKRQAAKLYRQGDKKEANELWLQIVEDRIKDKEEKQKNRLAKRGLV